MPFPQPPSSPPLPTFAIKDLCGPANPPGLISISKRRYDATLKSTPDAGLLYLDDDDGELITVGSSLELSQRLEEPVPRYIREFRDPADGKLVHVFDIKHTASSLAEWRDHEAYSSKRFGRLSPPFHSPRVERPPLPLDQAGSPTLSHVAYPSLPESLEDGYTSPSTISTLSPLPRSVVQKNNTEAVPSAEEPFNLLDGIEEHLSGLANVLQIAANILQKAADKTKDSDTSVVEDILKGVRGILTEVGSFGVEAFKELSAEASTAIDDSSTPKPADVTADTTSAREKGKIAAALLAQEAKEEFDLRNARNESTLQNQNPGLSKIALVEKAGGETFLPKVRFDLPEAAVKHSELAHPHGAQRTSVGEVKSSDPASTPGPGNLSFLDDFSEDADFTARYPPLNMIRRTRTTVERPSVWPSDPKEKARAQCKYYRAMRENGLPMPAGSFPDIHLPEPRWVLPFASSRSAPKDEASSARPTSTEDKAETADPVQKPLPGAWPDVKTDSTSALPTSAESSGDFFNRMVGRDFPGRLRTSGIEPGLHRANTTASSNPASRLNGPFDPGFPYEPSSASHRPSPFRPLRPHRRPTSSVRNQPDGNETARARHDNRRAHDLESGESASHLGVANADPSPGSVHQHYMDNLKRNELRRLVRRQRSVPHFMPSPFQTTVPKRDSADSCPPSGETATDFLSGPPMPMPPPMPFTTRPQFAPPPLPPNLWAPWQSSPPTQSNAEDRIKSSPVNSQDGSHNADSPNSSQSTSKDFDLPSNEPPFPSAQPQARSVSPPFAFRCSTPPRPPKPLPTFFPPPPPAQCMQTEPIRDKVDECVEQLKMCGFGIDDDNLKNRLHVYAVAADGDVMEAVDMIEQDRKMTAPGRFD